VSEHTRGLVIALFAAVTATHVPVGTPKPNVYRNPEFGIVLMVPAGALLCHIPADEHDHGPYMLLDGTSEQGCHDLEHNRSIDLFARYNVTADTAKLSEFLDQECTGVGGRACGLAPAGLRVPGLRSMAGKVERSDGWIDVFVVTQVAGSNGTVPGVNYAFTLRTTASELDKDLGVFRTVLRTVRLSPPAR